jgi:hypothetical protein
MERIGGRCTSKASKLRCTSKASKLKCTSKASELSKLRLSAEGRIERIGGRCQYLH